VFSKLSWGFEWCFVKIHFEFTSYDNRVNYILSCRSL
jgi:hypothetical protein